MDVIESYDVPKNCDVCREFMAVYDTNTIMGTWAYLCEDCMDECGLMTSVTVKIIWAGK